MNKKVVLRAILVLIMVPLLGSAPIASFSILSPLGPLIGRCGGPDEEGCPCSMRYGMYDWILFDCCGWYMPEWIMGLDYSYQVDYCTEIDDFEAIYACPDPCQENNHYLCYNTEFCLIPEAPER